MRIAVPARVRPLASNRPSIGSEAAVFALAGVIALIVSAEYLAQPFIWRNWPVAEVLVGWLLVLRDRLIVAAAMAGAIVAGRRLPAPGRMRRGAISVTSLLAGAAGGEALILAIDPFGESRDASTLLGETLRWSLTAAALWGIMASWRRQSDMLAAAEQAAVQQTQIRRRITADQLEALNRQIEPHFLFNTLAIVRRLGQAAPGEGRRLLGRLFDYVSAAFTADGSGGTTLGDELDLVGAYLDICGVRMGSRLTVEWVIDDRLRPSPFAPLVLGTLVENAIEHGLSPLPGGGTIAISAQRRGNDLIVGVRDTGVGLIGESGGGLGLTNLAARLRLTYGPAARFSLRPNDATAGGAGLMATIEIPHGLPL